MIIGPESQIKKRKSTYYAIDISGIMSAIYAVNKFIGFHPEFFNTNINKKIIYYNESLMNIYLEPLYFKDTKHNVRGYIVSTYDDKVFKMIINVKSSKKHKHSTCYVKQIEAYINNQCKHGDTIQLHYNKILSDVIIKHCYYEQPTAQWLTDVNTLQSEFFLPEKEYLMAIMNNKINNSIVGSASNSWNNLILHGEPGLGKCHGINTPILMYNGQIKMVQDIMVGELLMGDDSISRMVLSTCTGTEVLYTIAQEHDTYVVNKLHILSLVYCKNKTYSENADGTFTVAWDSKDHRENTKIFDYSGVALQFYHAINENTYIDISVEEYLNLVPFMQKRLKGYRKVIQFSEKPLSFSPYVLGLYVAHVNSRSDNTNYKQLLQYLLKNYIVDFITGIPDSLKINSVGIREHVLAGIIDNMGTYDRQTDVYTIPCCNAQFTCDLIYMCKSLGYSAFIENNTIRVYGQKLVNIPVQNINKKSLVLQHDNNNLHFTITVTENAVGAYYGFTLDKNHKYVLGNFIVTHNSSFVYRVSMTLKMSIVSVDLSLYLNKKKELYALFHGQEFCLPNATEKEPALNNYIIALEEFDTAIEKLLDIENIFKYKDILKRNYLNLKNKEIKKKALTFVNDTNDSDIASTAAPALSSDNYEQFMEKMMLDDGFDTRNNKVLDRAREDILEQRDQGNELNSINTELDNIIKSMDTDNKSNIVRLADLLELFQGPVPIAGRIIVATTNHYDKIKKSLPALFRAGRMTAIEFKYLDWPTLNKLTQYYFEQSITTESFVICIATSEIIEIAIKIKLNKQSCTEFVCELQKACEKKFIL